MNSTRKRVRDASSAAPTEPHCIVCFGDSNTHGANAEAEGRLPYADRWTTHLQCILGPEYSIIPEGLNGRTTVHDDPIDAAFAGLGGQNMNGRRYLLPCLHSHKPVAILVLALGCNDLKSRFNLNACEICLGLRLLIADARQSCTGPDGEPPRIIVMSPPACKGTPTSTEWGFASVASKSRATIAVYRNECAAQDLPFVDLSSVAEVGKDGIHFAPAAAAPIAEAVAKAVLELMGDVKP